MNKEIPALITYYKPNKDELCVEFRTGNLDNANYRLLNDQLIGVFHLPAKHYIFDFKKVTVMDASGMGTMHAMALKAITRNARVSFINVNQHVRNVLRLIKIGEYVDIFAAQRVEVEYKKAM